MSNPAYTFVTLDRLLERKRQLAPLVAEYRDVCREIEERTRRDALARQKVEEEA